jgi:anhydro-N-acetylmuramic acid kinase
VFGAAWLETEAPRLAPLDQADRLATLAAFTAAAVAQELERWGPALPPGTPLLVSGGGGRHRRVRQELAARLPGLRPGEDLQFPAGAREAVSWALLGAASAAGVPGSLPEVTGASRAAVLGSWVPG